MRRTASCCQPLQVSSVPRAARTGRGPATVGDAAVPDEGVTMRQVFLWMSVAYLPLMPAPASHFFAMSARLAPVAASPFIVMRSLVVSFAETSLSVLVTVSVALAVLISG